MKFPRLATGAALMIAIIMALFVSQAATVAAVVPPIDPIGRNDGQDFDTGQQPTPTIRPTLVIEGVYATPDKYPEVLIPPAMPLAPRPEGDIVTVLLLGSDSLKQTQIQRTDVIVLLAINRTAGTVSMLTFPRDLYVYAPNLTMMKLNSVVGVAQGKFGPGGGIKTMREAMLYNFGLKVDYYARINFTGFKRVIEVMGGLDITVDCGIQGNKLKASDLDPTLPENYEVYTINIGRHTLDPDTALWYVRARGSTGELDRGRREIEVLRAIYKQARRDGLIGRLQQLWPAIEGTVETDMTINDLLGLVPMALSMDLSNIQRLAPVENVHIKRDLTPETGQFIFLPMRDAYIEMAKSFMQPPTRNRLGAEQITVELGASRSVRLLEPVAYDRLTWEGFRINRLDMEGLVARENTAIIDYTGGALPEQLETLRRALRVRKENIINQPTPGTTAQFRVELGARYAASCLYKLPAQPTPTPGG